MEPVDDVHGGKTASKPGTIVAQVNYVYEDDTVPGWTALGEKFVKEMVSRYHFATVPSGLDDKMNLLERLRSLDVEDSNATMQLTRLEFNQGTYRAKDGSAHTIRDVSLSHDRIYCMVEGGTDVGERILEEAAQLACQMADVSWKNLQGKLLYTHYATASTERLGVTGTELLSAGMIRFVKEVLRTPEIALAMNPKVIGSEPTKPDRVNVVVHPFDFKIKVRVANLDSNDIDTHDVSLSIRKVTDHDAGVFVFQTGLPSEEHLRVVALLKDLVRKT